MDNSSALLIKSVSNDIQSGAHLTMTMAIYKKILWYCWEDCYSPFAWKVSLSLVSKGFFKIIQVLASKFNMSSKNFYIHYQNPLCIFKNVTEIHCSFLNLIEGFIDCFQPDLLEKGVWMEKNSQAKQDPPIQALEHLDIKGADTYVKNEKLALQILLSNNLPTLEHFSIYSQKSTLFKNIYSHLESSTKISSVGMGFLYSDKSIDALVGFLKIKSSFLRSFQIAFDKKSLKDADSAQMTQLHQDIFTQNPFSSLKVLKLGHKKLTGQSFAPQTYSYPLQCTSVLFDSLQLIPDLQTLRIYRDEADIKEQKDFNAQFYRFFKQNKSITYLELPCQSDANIMNLVAEKTNLKSLIISPTGEGKNMVCFNEALEKLTFFEMDNANVRQFFDKNYKSSQIKHLTFRDYIDFGDAVQYLTFNHNLRSFKASLKGKQQFVASKNPFLCLSDSKLKKLCFRFSNFDKPTDYVNRLFRSLALNDTVQYLKIVAQDFDPSQVLTGDFVYHNKNEFYNYYSRSLPRRILTLEDAAGMAISSWRGIENKLENLITLVNHSKEMCDKLNDMCQHRPDYNSPYLLDYIKETVGIYQKEQWERSDPILQCAYQAYNIIKEQDNYIFSLIANDNISREFLREQVDKILSNEITSSGTPKKKF
ncbi:hypothetical protein DLAC_03674 [Tieghemostelium lacteum]|uniref:Uncharacterized protein n=1 Tax=Tieghemostelium lacteum TaxID=361077 RepID=A0A152A0X4_TIELA|nr:hypothetical protein DLAC_03674 [Tieghemostelium lacteum]|eukprot:KYQ99734.1 hypothetical protein DLAC_03674 [Tieghemostelium lacteum]